MSGAVRFLAIIVVGWVGVRVAGASLLPETGLVAEPAKAAPTLASKPPVAPPPAMPQTAATGVLIQTSVTTRSSTCIKAARRPGNWKFQTATT